MTFGWAGGYAEVGNMAKTPTVKCMATGVQGPRDQFYKAPNNRYFQSEAVYQAWLAGRRKEKAKKNKADLLHLIKQNYTVSEVSI